MLVTPNKEKKCITVRSGNTSITVCELEEGVLRVNHNILYHGPILKLWSKCPPFVSMVACATEQQAKALLDTPRTTSVLVTREPV